VVTVQSEPHSYFLSVGGQKAERVILSSATGGAAPHFDARSRIFELDSCGGNGKVCLVYRRCSAGAAQQVLLR